MKHDSQWLANESMKYHLNQWQSQKESTIAFEKFISQNLRDSKSVLDLGCGAGAPTSYLANRHPDVLFEGIDLETDLIDTANALVKGQISRTLPSRSATFLTSADSVRDDPSMVLFLSKHSVGLADMKNR